MRFITDILVGIIILALWAIGVLGAIAVVYYTPWIVIGFLIILFSWIIGIQHRGYDPSKYRDDPWEKK